MSMQARWLEILRSPRLGDADEPFDVRDPEIVRALADAVAILDADFRPRIMLGRLGAYADAGSRGWATRASTSSTGCTTTTIGS